MRFQFKVPIDKIMALTPGKSLILHNGEIYFNAVKIHYIVSGDCDSSNNYKLGFYVLPVLDKADIFGELTCVFGIVNSNGNLCRKSRYNHKYTLADTEPIGNIFYEYSTLSQIISYDIGGEILFGMDILAFDRSCNNDIILRDIYDKLNAGTVHSLKEQLQAMSLQNTEQAVLIADLIKKAEDTNRVPVATSVPAPAAEASPCCTAAKINIDLFSKDELYLLQEKITQALKIIDTCNICRENKANATLVPCGHVCCYACAERISVCHLCRANITLKVKTY